MARENLIISVQSNGTRRVKRSIKGIGDESRRAEQGVSILKRALAFAGVAVAVRSVVGTLASFSQGLSTVRAITEATDAQFARLRSTAEELGATTRFSATQAAEGMTALSRAGFDVTQTIDTVDDTLRLAQAGALDLGRAAEITAGAIRGFRVGTDQAERFVDVLAKTANSASTDVNDLGEAMKFVAPAAASLKVPFETASAALATLADNQLRGTLGGTGLRKVLSTLAKGGKPLQNALKRAGLTIADVDVTAVGLTGALRNLEKANIDVGEAFQIFGDRGQPAFDILVNNIPKIDEFDKKLQNAGGTARRIADVMDDNLNGALLSLRSAAESVVLSFGKLGAETGLTSFVRLLAKGLRAVSGDADILKGILTVLGLVVLPLVLNGIIAITAAIAANPLGALSIALAVIVGYLVTFSDEIIVSADGVTTLGDVAKATFEVLSAGFLVVREAAAEAVEIIVQAWNGAFGDNLPGTFEGFAIVVAKGVDSIIGTFSGIGAVIVTAFEDPIGAAKFLMIEFVNFQIRNFNRMTRLISRALEILKDRVILILSNLPGVAQSTLDAIGNARVTLPQLEELPQIAGETGQLAGDAFQIAFQKSTQAQDLVSGIFDRAREIGQERVNAGPTEDELDSQARLNELLNAQSEATGNLAVKTREANEAAQGSKPAFKAFRDSLVNAELSAQDFGEALSGIVVGAVQSLSDAIADAVVDGISNFEDFKDALSNIFKQIAKQIIALIIQFIILKIISAISGDATGGAATGNGSLGGGNAIGGGIASLGTRQAGGPVTRGEPVIVGEEGPEVFVPPSNGNIQPNSQMAASGGAPEVTVINVQDPNEVPAALESSAGEQAILNVLSKNSRQVQSIIQGGA